jgi:hypothetical protein
MDPALCRPKNLMLARSTGSIGTTVLREGPAPSRTSAGRTRSSSASISGPIFTQQPDTKMAEGGLRNLLRMVAARALRLDFVR